MNKLLTTITLLCFSVAANAEVWFCEPDLEILQLGPFMDVISNYETLTIRQGFDSFEIESAETSPIRKRIIIDTEKGVKESLNQQNLSEDYEGNYEGNCQIMIDGIKCSKGSEFADQKVWILNTEFKNYSEIFITPSLIQSYTGTCTKA
tara:strand:- start:43 stop:489 length:447 start_codon:yes stop_codon:yes gene_type:complete